MIYSICAHETYCRDHDDIQREMNECTPYFTVECDHRDDVERFVEICYFDLEPSVLIYIGRADSPATERHMSRAEFYSKLAREEYHMHHM